MYIAPGQGWQSLGTTFLCQQEHLVTLVICCKFQKISLKSDFIHLILFHDFIHGTGANSPQGTKFWCQQKCLVTSFICCKFQNNVFEIWFYTFFHDLIHVYNPGAAADSPQWTKSLMSTERPYHLPICCKFQRNLFEVWFCTVLFAWFNICI